MIISSCNLLDPWNTFYLFWNKLFADSTFICQRHSSIFSTSPHLSFTIQKYRIISISVYFCDPLHSIFCELFQHNHIFHAQLAKDVVPTNPHMSTSIETHAVECTTCNSHNFWQMIHLFEFGINFIFSQAHLMIRIFATSPNTSMDIQKQRVIAAANNTLNGRKSLQSGGLVHNLDRSEE